MKLVWSLRAVKDLQRLHLFLLEADAAAAVAARRALEQAPLRLLDFPRLGQRLERHQEAEVRRLVVGPYELRYLIDGEAIVIASIWHGREQR